MTECRYEVEETEGGSWVLLLFKNDREVERRAFPPRPDLWPDAARRRAYIDAQQEGQDWLAAQ
jgi:hypothetical protein